MAPAHHKHKVGYSTDHERAASVLRRRRPRHRIAGLWRRLGAQLLDGILVVVTLYFGWILITAFLATKGQTPGKALLGIRVVEIDTGLTPSYGTMFLRDQILTGPLGMLLVLPMLFAMIDPWFIFGGEDNQTWKDRLQNTVVVEG